MYITHTLKLVFSLRKYIHVKYVYIYTYLTSFPTPLAPHKKENLITDYC